MFKLLLLCFCVFTGTATSIVLADAMHALKNVGGEPRDAACKDTDYLVVGNDGYGSTIHSASGKLKSPRNQIKSTSNQGSFRKSLPDDNRGVCADG